MKFPVDLLADASLAELERSAHNYMNNLLYSNPDSPEHLTISASTKVTIDISSVGFVPLYGSDDRCKILALFSPSDPFVAVGLYLLDRWWAVEDILKTADPARDGVLEVETVGDRIVLYILNRVVYRGKEKTSDELPFLCHGEKDYAKIVWNNGEAVGFYSVKPSGTTCNSFSVRTYQLSVMDSIFVRKCQRRKGFGLQMLVDFVLSFKEEESLGLRYPLTKSMYKVCEKYLCQYPGDADLLWEVENIGGPKQRTNIARKIMAIDISVSKNLSFSEESLLTPDVVETVLKETTTLERSVETMEEVTVLRATKEIDDVPVVLQRSSIHSKQRTTEEKMTEDTSEKVIRIEEIEAETPRKERVSVQRETELLDSQELEQTEVLLSVYKEKAEDVVDTVPEGGPTMRSNKPAAVLTSGDLAEDHVTSATMTEEQHVEDDATQNLHNKSHDSQITVENVASETQEAEVCEKEEEADIPFGGDAEENILPVELDEETSQKDEETPANDEQVHGVYEEGETLIERRVLRSGKKMVRATTRIKTTKRQDGEQEAEADGANTEGDAPAEDRQSKQAQEETEETTVTKEIQVDKTKAVLEETQEITETRGRKTEDKNEEEAEVQKNENPEPEVEIEEVEAVERVSLREQDTAEEEQSIAEEEGKIMEMEIKPGNDAEQGEAQSAPGEVEDSVLPKSAADSTVVLLSEEEATPSSEEQQNEETICPISGLQGLTVVSVDMKKDVGVHEETAATEEAVPVEKIADEAEEEQREETMEQEKTIPEEQIHDSSMEIEKTEIVKGIVEEEGLEEKVEDTVIVEDTREGSAEETGGEKKTISDNEQTSTVNQTRTPRGRKKQVTAPTGHESVRVLRSGRKSVLGKQTRTRKSTQKQIQKDESEEGEESPSAEGTDPEEEAEQTPVIDQEKGEIIENDASQQEESSAPEMNIENMNTVAEEVVTQDVPEVGQTDSTETITDEDVEALVEKADEGMTSDVVEKEAVTGPETVEAEESTSEVEETAAGEDSENNLLTSNDDQEEETPVTERRVLRSGTPKITATPQKATRSRKKADEQEAKNTKKQKHAMTAITRRQGRKSANAPPEDESRRTHKQAQEEGQEDEDNPEGLDTTGLGDELNTTQDPVVEKTDEEIEGEDLKEIEKQTVEVASENIEYLELSVGLEEGKAVEDEQAMIEEGTISATEEENIATVTATAGVLVQEEETDTLLLDPATDSAELSLKEEEAAPSSVKQQTLEMASQAFGLQRLTVVLVDMKKTVEVHKETAATEEAVPVEKIADEAEEEQREETMKQEQTMPEEQIHDSSMEIEKTEIVKGIVEEEGLEEKVEDTREGSAEEMGGENKTVSENEQNSTANQTRTPRGRKKQVTAPTGHESVRVLRSGRKSVLGKQTLTRKSTQKQIQKDESEEGEESPSAEGTDPEEEAEQTPVIDQEKGEIIENDASQQEETPAPEMDIENMNTEAEEAVTQDVPEVGQADSTETITEEDAEALVGKADEGMTSDVVEKEAVTGPETVEAEESTSEVEETAAGEDSENNLLTSNDDQEEETPVTERRVLRSGKKTVRAITRIKTTKRQDGEQEAETETVTEEIQVDNTKAVLEEAEEIKETRDRENEDKNEEEAEVQKNENPEPEVEIEQGEAVEGGSLREQDTAEEEQSTTSVTSIDREEVTSIQECAEETPDEGKVPSDEDTVADETTIVDQTADEAEEESSTAKEIHTAETKDNITEEIEEKDGEDDASQKDDTEDTLNTDVDKASDEMETPAVESRILRSGGKLAPTTPVSVETRILRKGRRSAPATTRRKSKRARIQRQPEEESDEETAPAQEPEGEEGEVGQESPEKNGEKAEEEGKIMEMEVKPGNDAEEGEAESAPGGEYVLADAEQTKDSVIEETAVLEGDNSKTDVVETDIIQSSSAEIEETNSTEEEEVTNIEKSTPVTEVVSDTAIAEEEALDEGAHEVAEEDAPAATTMSLRSKTKTSRTTRRSRGQKTQEPVQTKPQQEEENIEDVETQEVPPMTDNSPEQREQKEEQTEAEEMLATGQEADEDVAERIDNETSDSRVAESLGDDTQSADKEEEEKVESDEDKDNMADDVSDNQHIKKLEEGNEEENLENAVEAGEKGSIVNSTLDTDEEVETPGVSQTQENDEQNMSEEEMESILIGKRVLRSRTVPSVVITPQSKSRRRSAKVEIAEESSSDEEKSPQSSKRRSLRKRKSTDVTPAHKLRRSSRV